jgi:hypothetical protein
MRWRTALPLTALALAAAADASAGWHARQTNATEGQPAKQTSDLYYEDHKLRVDTPEQAMIIDLATGGMTVIDPKQKIYAEVTLDELLRMRDEALVQMKQQLSRMPPQIRAQVEKQLETMEKAAKADLKLTRTGKKRTLHGFACEDFAWSGPDGDGEACIAARLPIDVGPFRKDVDVLRAKMAEKGAGTGAAALALLQLARDGFPVWSKQTMTIGPTQLVSITELVSIEKATVPAEKLRAPAGFTKKPFRELAGAPGMP